MAYSNAVGNGGECGGGRGIPKGGTTLDVVGDEVLASLLRRNKGERVGPREQI